MKFIINSLIIFISFLSAQTIEINNNSKKIDLLSNSKIYIDKTRNLDIHTIQDKNFKENKKGILGFGYNPDLDLWTKFTLKNSLSQEIHKIIEYDNPLTTTVEFYEKKGNKYIQTKEGLYHFKDTRNTKNPIFYIDLNAGEEKTYYIKATSYVTTLIVKLKLWHMEEFYKKELQNQFILALFFGAMVVLGLYNLFIYFITRDISYLYYVLYILGISFHHLLYVGIGNVYIFDNITSEKLTHYAAVFVTFPIYALALFTKTFLNTKQYKYWNRVLDFFLVFIPIATLLIVTVDIFSKYRTLFVLCLFTFLIMITIYASIKKNKQAYYILFGWSIILAGATLMFLSSFGVFNIYQYFPYIIEVIIIVEALIFSIALAAKIRVLEKEKNEVNKRLIEHQKNVQISLKEEVEKKTKALIDLNENLEQRINKEVNHVKQIERKLFESEKMVAMGEMMGNIAHQWRQPLSVISTLSSGLLVRKEFGKLDDSVLDKSLVQIVDMTKHLSQTIDDFRDYIRGDMKKSEFSLASCIQKSVGITDASLKSNYIEVFYELDEEIIIENYENALLQSIVNIVNNARDALKQNIEDMEKRFIFLRMLRHGDKIYIFIKDSAGGIPEDIIARIFEPYFTTKDKDQGTGLGLHMTYNLITTSMNGSIEVKNVSYEHNKEIFKGAEFKITLNL